LRPAQAKVRCYLKNELKQKGLEVWFMRQNACLASTNPELSLWYCQKKKKEKKPKKHKTIFCIYHETQITLAQSSAQVRESALFESFKRSNPYKQHRMIKGRRGQSEDCKARHPAET
jgi:hypothetical protein